MAEGERVTLNENVFPPLNLLLKAQSKDIVRNLFQEAFTYRNRQVPNLLLKTTASSLSIEFSEVVQLFNSLCAIVSLTLFECMTDPKAVYQIFPEDFHKNLRELISRVIAERMPTWRNSAVNNQVSLPKLVDFDWRVDVKTSSDAIGRMSMPTCIMQLKVEDCETQEDVIPEIHCLNVELTKEKLDTMLDGLGKIRDQLSSVAK